MKHSITIAGLDVHKDSIDLSLASECYNGARRGSEGAVVLFSDH
jgi:hypothetical protein